MKGWNNVESPIGHRPMPQSPDNGANKRTWEEGKQMAQRENMRKTLEDLADAVGPDLFHRVMDEIEKLADEVEFLSDRNRALQTEFVANKKTEAVSLGGEYWQNICQLNARQEEKGRGKYGVPLEENETLTTVQRIEHAQEEAIDLLKYLEHLKKVVDADGITANDYQRAALRTAGDDPSKYLINGVMGLCGEAGEVIDVVKKHLHQGHELDKDKVVEELGDCLWYAAVIASAVEVPLGEVMRRNVDKLMRRYPDGFDKARSINRKENADDCD